MIDSPLLNPVHAHIQGRWVAADSARCFAVHNPATGEQLAEVPALGAAETARAIDAARHTLATPHSLVQRQHWLEDIARVLRENKEELGRIVTLEHGKPWQEGQGEVEYAAGFFAQCARQIHELAPRTLADTPRDCRWTVHYRPAGVVGLITPWNFPIGMIAKKLSAAIAADCPSVIKPSSKTPLTLIALMKLLDEHLDLPAGYVNLVTGPAGPISECLMGHPDVRVVSFTGSTGVGKRLIEQSAAEVKKLTLELGGNAPYIVFEDADLDAAADNFIGNKFRGGGQTCVCANRLYVHQAVEQAFSEKLIERVSRLKVGDGMEEGTDIGPLIDRNGFDKVHQHLRDALDQGAELIHGEPPTEPAGDGWGHFFPPVILRGVRPGMRVTREETFGPLVAMIAFDNEEDVIAQANDTEFGLAGYVFSGDLARGARVAGRLRCGHVGLNTGTGPTPEAPFGGMKESGYGREGGQEGLFEFVEVQTIPQPL
ncbi:NAD-dependent succinate-semialdehyde dehydrogenase [Alkalilimnicola sp. S0819]|uniref:NAD-dependent succinate-semialdehyde dehydrogenase n=1 Tax=Alkalilimnicola sp. S0819 TaxID=2613922 RepID=UPI0012624BE2|nr:NAD-dependent succinate-semialdehyde dehydrogenase [Alkalilimnicola sp. S0819]KAB7623727.1 NAD-dependent succinate-semialdehyde dehydrogenase [Alkalilimnicola sp. S0819]MPQ16856.1 aldehyde dehydrogenase family protein [Alkalilimnicola sp. S0819]